MQDVETANEVDFVDLLSRIRSGDKAAESVLVQRFWRGLYFILYRQTGDQELCRDLTQDALLLVVANAREGLIEHPEALSAYVRKVGENKLIGFRRKQKRQRTDTASDVIDRMVDMSGSLVANVRKEQLGAYVRTVLSELGRERDQEILKRHYLVGESKDEICSALDLTRSQADVVLHRARHRLKELILRKEGDGSGPRATDLLVLVATAALLVKETAASLHFYIAGAKPVCATVLAARRQWVARYG